MSVVYQHGLRFQSTPSAGRTTHSPSRVMRDQVDFNPRPPQGGRHFCCFMNPSGFIFQSTPSAGRATDRYSVLFRRSASISIHALRREGDGTILLPSHHALDFNPRPPQGGRPLQSSICLHKSNFNPRPPQGGRHNSLSASIPVNRISIHVLRREGDNDEILADVITKVFQSTPSAGRATCDDNI